MQDDTTLLKDGYVHPGVFGTDALWILVCGISLKLGSSTAEYVCGVPAMSYDGRYSSPPTLMPVRNRRADRLEIAAVQGGE